MRAGSRLLSTRRQLSGRGRPPDDDRRHNDGQNLLPAARTDRTPQLRRLQPSDQVTQGGGVPEGGQGGGQGEGERGRGGEGGTGRRGDGGTGRRGDREMEGGGEEKLSQKFENLSVSQSPRPPVLPSPSPPVLIL